jgi:DNA-binding IclR family transcriptional regulator
MRPIAEQGTPASAGTQAIARAAALLREIAAHSGGARVVDLAHALALERPTVHRILRRLVEERLVVQDPSGRHYRLGPLVYELGLLTDPPAPLHSASGPALQAIADESGDTAFAFVLSAFDTVCLDRREGSYPVKALLLSVGGRRPIGTGPASLAMLAMLPPQESARLLEANARRLAAIDEQPLPELAALVERGRADGYVAKHPPGMPEILSLAVPVTNAYGQPVMALSVSALAHRIERRHEALLALLRTQAREVSRRLRETRAVEPRETGPRGR